ncbi:MAG TPA: hypothetical protein VME42_06230 [Steroidobacteraceae bacterium]|nr:hypothetical protein [Steroidobacteraceae bacterium]
MRMICVWLIGACAAAAGAGASVAASADPAVSLVGSPLVMRLNKDEFRIAFGLEGAHCLRKGCNGSVLYRVHWKGSDGMLRSEAREVSYSVPPSARRTIAVDRQYLDSAEGAQRTEVVSVSVDRITCR